MGGEDRRGGEVGEDGVSVRRAGFVGAARGRKRGQGTERGMKGMDGWRDGGKEGARLFVFVVTHVCFVVLSTGNTSWRLHLVVSDEDNTCVNLKAWGWIVKINTCYLKNSGDFWRASLSG